MPDPQYITEEGPVEMTDYDLVTLIIHHMLVWCVKDGKQFCYIMNKQHHFIDVDPNQAESLRQQGIIQPFPADDDTPAFQWHLSKQGWDYAFTRPKLNA